MVEVQLSSMKYLVGNKWSKLVGGVSESRIDGIDLKTPSSKPYMLHYRTYTKEKGWLPYVTSLENDYAGFPNLAMEALQIKVSDISGNFLDSDYVVMYRTYNNGNWLPWVSNANPAIMNNIKSKYNLPGTLDTSGSDAGLPGSGSNVNRIEIRVFEGEFDGSDDRSYGSGTALPPVGGLRKVFIDAGHGGSDPGAVGNGLNESDVVLSISKKLGSILTLEGISVAYSRTSDTYVSLEGRAEQANNWGSTLFVSIHANAAVSSAFGTECYTYPNTDDKNKELSRNVSEAIANKFGISNRGHKEEDFAVLRLTNMPAILVETAFISNANDADLLRSKQDDFATTIANEILNYFGV
jgi:N-acetylmuramoyl-L-alanine amidase